MCYDEVTQSGKLLRCVQMKSEVPKPQSIIFWYAGTCDLIFTHITIFQQHVQLLSERAGNTVLSVHVCKVNKTLWVGVWAPHLLSVNMALSK